MDILNRFSTYPSDLVGLVSFSAATIACFIAARRSGGIWNFIALMNALFVLEIYFGLRYRITETAKTLLASKNLYSPLHGWFQEAIIALVVAIVIMCFFFLRRIAGSRARAATVITIAVLALFGIETVSLHAIDAIFYRPVGPILLLGWIWAVAASGIVLAARRPRTAESH